MRSLLKVMLILGAVFASTFVIARLLGILTEDNVRHWLTEASGVSVWWIGAIVVALLFIDLFVAVPTLTVTILAGYFMGFAGGASAAFLGMMLAAICGYAICHRYGEGLIARLVRDDTRRQELTAAFHRNGPAMILLSRAAPILPEVTACMAGATRMRFSLYLALFAVSTLPYAGIAAWAGSISTIDDPLPAIYAALLLYGVMWAGWAIHRSRTRRGTRAVRRTIR